MRREGKKSRRLEERRSDSTRQDGQMNAPLPINERTNSPSQILPFLFSSPSFPKQTHQTSSSHHLPPALLSFPALTPPIPHLFNLPSQPTNQLPKHPTTIPPSSATNAVPLKPADAQPRKGTRSRSSRKRTKKGSGSVGGWGWRWRWLGWRAGSR